VVGSTDRMDCVAVTFEVAWVMCFFFSVTIALCGSRPPPWFSSIGCGGFITVGFPGMGLLAPCPTPNLDDRGLHCLAWVALAGAYASPSIALRVIGVYKSPVHKKAVFLRKVHKYRTTFLTAVYLSNTYCR
jgi:hypothetical protein